MYAKAYIEITNRCNLRCAFCPGTKRAPRDMSAEEFALLAPAVRRVTSFIYLHLMGEPLLHPQLPQILELAQENELRVIITTNGTLLPKYAALLQSHSAVHKINISLHSLEANGAIPPEGYLRACGEFARSAGIAGKICCLRLWNLNGEVPGLNAQNNAILAYLHTIFPAPWTENSRGFCLSPKVFLEWGERFEWPDIESRDRGTSGFCYALRDHFGILSDGTVVPCCLDHEGSMALGNAFRQSLAELLHSPQAKQICEGFSQRRRTQMLCQHCGYAERFSK